MFKTFILLLVLTVLTITSSMAMDPIRVAGQASSTNVKNVTLDLTIRVYDASRNEIYHVGIPNIYFDKESVFSFVWDALFVTYNPMYLVKIENSANGIELFESRLDKIVNAQVQFGALVDPLEINGSPTPGLVLVSNGSTTDWSTITPAMLPFMDLQTAYNNSINSAPYMSVGGKDFGNGKIIDVTGNKIKIVRERTAGGNIGSALNAVVSNPEDGYSAFAASIQDINYDDATFVDAPGSEFSAIEGKLDDGSGKWFGLLGAAVNMDGGLPTPAILKAGVLGVTPSTTSAGALGVTFGGNDYAGYFVGDVNITGAATALTYNGFTLPAGDAPLAGDILASTGTNKTLTWITPGGGGGGGGGGASWLLGGNLGTIPGTMFLGTLDAQDVVFKLNNTIAGTLGTDNNTSFGLNSMHNVVTSGNNTGMGAEALYTLTSGTENAALGYQAMYTNSTGNYNTGVGTKALYSNGAGMNNTATGFAALYSNGTGYYNTASGYAALHENSTGSWNTASGYNALYSNTSGEYNSAFGYEALYYNTDGNSNVAIGYNAGSLKADGATSMTSAENSIYIGNGAKGAMAANTNEIAIGYNAIGAGSNTVTLGSASSTGLYSMAAVNTTTANPPNLFVDSNGQIMKSTASVPTSAPTVTAGSVDPILALVIPGKIGDIYINVASAAHYVYIAYGTAAGEWTQLN